jgi:hypothetical protein
MSGNVSTSDDLTARRVTSYHGTVFSRETLTEPSYVEVEITARESSWRCVCASHGPLSTVSVVSVCLMYPCSGHMEIGLIPGSLAMARDPTNLSDFGAQIRHFKIAGPTAYHGTAETERAPQDPLPGDARFDRRARYGLLFAHGRMTLICRMPEAYHPVKMLEMEASFSEPPRLAVNMYGQTHHVRIVNPKA